MNSEKITYKAVKGQTFSLFGNSGSTVHYYNTIASLAYISSKKAGSETELLHLVQELIRKKKQLRNIYLSESISEFDSYLLKLLYPALHPYTMEVNNHLNSLPLAKRYFDQTLNTNEFQYHLQMLEVELLNRINKVEFRKATQKFALLPHCLRDFTKKCKAEMGDIDFVCKSCSNDCFIQLASASLAKYDVKAYIWMTINLKKLAHTLKSINTDFGILGIACFPELVNGMRMCMKAGIPVVGIPLNANRCSRWTGSSLENSVDIEALDNLLI